MMEIDEQTPLVPIGIVEELTGLSKRQIRYYDKLGLVVPERTEGNKRRYSLNELKDLFLIRDKLAVGCSIEEIKKMFETTDYNYIEKSITQPEKTNRFDDEQRINLYTPSYLDVMLERLTKDKKE